MDASVVVHVQALVQLALSAKVTAYSLLTNQHVSSVELAQVHALQVLLN
jgi:hypothetical protein